MVIQRIVFNKTAKIRAENEEIIVRFSNLCEILFDARNSYELWWVYLKEKGRKENFQVFLEYVAVFETMGYSSISNLIVNLYKLYDKQKSVYSILDLLKDIEKRNLLSKAEKKIVDKNLDFSLDVWAKVLKLRHNLFAHRNKDLTVKQIYDRAGVTPNNLRDMTKHTLELLNCIAPKLCESKRKFHRGVIKDFLRLLKKLKNG